MGWQQKNDASSGRQKILVDSSRDAGIIKIIVPASIATFLLLFREITFYTNNPQELMDKLGVVSSTC